MGIVVDQSLNTSDSVEFAGMEIVDGDKSVFLYNTKTDASNYERGGMWWDTNTLYIGGTQAGTGSSRSIVIQCEGITYITLNADTNSVRVSRSLDPSSNNSVRLGYSSLRWSDIYGVDLDCNGTVIKFENLPTSDPAVAGVLWNDSGTVKVSAG